MRLFIIAMIFYLSVGLTAAERTDSLTLPAEEPEQLTVSLVTCAPGPDVYALCGHEAVRIRSEKMDSIWNYGIFDFTSPNFLYRFCKGETDYMVRGYEFPRFMPEYVNRGSTVWEQVLDLSQEDARALRKLLQTEALPQNCIYRYNYVKDNCATRPWLRVNQAASEKITVPDTTYFKSFRNEMRYFHHKYPWYQFGIDLALGSGIDKPLEKDQDMFAPPVMAEKVAMAKIGDRPLVKATNVIFRGVPDATEGPTPWILSPMALAIVMLALSFWSLWLSIKKGKALRWWVSVYYGLAGLAGCVICFLVFFSVHEATSSNVMIWWLNPLQWLLAIGVWIPKMRWVNAFMSGGNAIIGFLILGATLLGLPMYLSMPDANPAIAVMMLAGFVLSISVYKTLGESMKDLIIAMIVLFLVNAGSLLIKMI